MTHEQIESAIERLSILDDDNRRYSMRDVVRALIGEDSAPIRLSHTIAYLLQQADPDTHMELPKDADGEPIDIGDEVESDSYEDGRVIGIEYREGMHVQIAVLPHGWDTSTWYDPEGYRHHHKPTVEEVMRSFASEWYVAVGNAAHETKVMGRYIDKLREVIDDE